MQTAWANDWTCFGGETPPVRPFGRPPSPRCARRREIFAHMEAPVHPEKGESAGNRSPRIVRTTSRQTRLRKPLVVPVIATIWMVDVWTVWMDVADAVQALRTWVETTRASVLRAAMPIRPARPAWTAAVGCVLHQGVIEVWTRDADGHGLC